jgi:hypothetical protein
MHGTLFKLFFHGESTAGKYGKHRSVLRKYFSPELRHTFFSGNMNEVSQDTACHPLTMVVFLDGKSNFSAAQCVWGIVKNIPPRSDDGLFPPHQPES